MPHLIRSVFNRMQTYAQEREHPPRVRVRLLFTVSLCRKSHGQGLRPERALKGYTRDLSPGGLALKVPQVHLDGHYLADEDREVKVKLELPTGPISMRVSPRRHERLEQPELGCKYLIGVQITDISDEDRKRYLSFIFPEDRRNFPAPKKQIATENGRSLRAVHTESATEEEVASTPVCLEPAHEETRVPAWWHGLSWHSSYQLTEISDEDRRRCLKLISPQVAHCLSREQDQYAPENVKSLHAVGKELTSRKGLSHPAIQSEIVSALEVARAPIKEEPTRRRLRWKPIYAAAVVLIAIPLVIGAALQLKRRAANLQAKETKATPVLDDRTANDLTPVAGPNESPVENADSSAIIALKDRPGLVTVDNGGSLSGLDDVPAPTREDIARALLSERIARPAILTDLAGKENAVRAGENTQPFKLIFPARAVIVSDRPALKWERVAGASSYRVVVSDAAGQEMARSEELSSERTEWSVPKPLKRGEIYRWTVVAVVDGKEVVSPAPSTPEMKFQVLSARALQQLSQVKKTGSNLALGVFYSREGMIGGAERELQALVSKNPGSAVAKKLLVGVQSWQQGPVARSSSWRKNQSGMGAGAREVAVQVTYDENGRVTQASGNDPTALRIARQKRFPVGKAGSATIRIPIN